MAGIDSFTKLMLHNDDTGLSDSSLSPKTVTLNGNVARSNTQSKFGGFSAFFDGTGDYLSLADSGDWDVTDFTLDFWVFFPTLVDVDAYLFGQMDHSMASGGGIALLTNLVVGQYLQLDIQNSNPPVISAASGISADTWAHIAAVRSGSACNLFVNGNSIGTGTNGDATSSTNTLLIGLQPGTGGKDLNGYIDELRFSKGIARWTANFTPPTSAYTTDAKFSSKMMMMGIS